MVRIPLKAEERTILGKKVKILRRQGIIPAHVFGKKTETEHVAVLARDFARVYDTAGESGLIDLKIGAEKVRPVLIRDVQVDPVRGATLHVDFYQPNLEEKIEAAVNVWIPLELTGEEPEVVHTGEAVVIQPMNEVEVEALPAELPEKLVVDISKLKQIDDTVTISELGIPEGVTILADAEAVVAKLDNAVSEEAQKLMEEVEAEQEAVAVEVAEEAAEEAPAEATTGRPAEGEEGKEAVEGEAPIKGEIPETEKPQE